MKLSDILRMLAEVENGADAVVFLKGYLADKEKEISQAEGKASTAETRLQSIAKDLGVSEAELESTVKAFKASGKELDNTKALLEAKDNEIATLKGNVSSLERKSLLADFAQAAGADKDVLVDLLPSELELKIEEKTQDGKPIKKALVVIEGKTKEFADYVNDDPKLTKFKASIFTQQQNPPKTPAKLPQGKGEDRDTSLGQIGATYIQKRRSGAIDKIKERLNK